MALNKFINKPSPLIRSICCLPTLDASSRARTISRNTAFENAYVIYFFKWHFGGCLTIQTRRLAARSSTRLTTRLNSVKRLNSKPSGEREIRLSARTGEFTRVSGACNGEFGGAAVSHVAHFASEIALSGAIILTLLLVCSFSPKVQSIFWGPRYIDCTESLF